MPFLRRSATASNWILMRGVRERGGVRWWRMRPRELFSLCTIGERALLAISFNNYGHSIPSHSSARSGAPAANFSCRAKKTLRSRVAYFRERRAAPVRVCLLASSRPLILFTYVLPRGWQTAWIRKIPACKSNLGPAVPPLALSLCRAGLCIFHARIPSPGEFSFLSLLHSGPRASISHQNRTTAVTLPAQETNNCQDIRLCIIHGVAKATKVCLNPGQNERLNGHRRNGNSRGVTLAPQEMFSLSENYGPVLLF